MSDMIERVARAILEETLVDKGHRDALDAARALARAAIEEMRDPTPDMWWAGAESDDSAADILRLWAAMIDAALAREDA